MPKYLLDTNACIAIRNSFRGVKSKDAARLAAHDRLIDRWRQTPAQDLAMSFISLGELSVWVEKHSDQIKARQLLNLLVAAVPVLGAPAGTAGGSADAVARGYGLIRAALARPGKLIPHNDMWIAAHALSLGMTVVTGDVSDFGRVPGLTIEDWTA